MSTRSFKNQPRQGAVLLAVLGLVFLLSVIIVQFLRFAQFEIENQAHSSNQDELRVKAYSALEYTLASLAEYELMKLKLHNPRQGWGNLDINFLIKEDDNIELKLTITDETGKIPLRYSDQTALENLLGGLFNEMDFTLSEATELKDCLLDWIDDDDERRFSGAEKFDYQREKPPYSAYNEPLSDFETLRYIRGFSKLFYDKEGTPNDHYWKFIESVSLYHNKPINLNTASELTLKTIVKVENPSFSFSEINDYLNGPDGKRGTKDDQSLKEDNALGIKQPAEPFRGKGQVKGGAEGPQPKPEEKQHYGIEASMFKVQVLANRGEIGYTLTVIYEYTKDSKENSYKIIKIAENRQFN